MAVNVDKQREKLTRMVDALAKEQAKLLMAEKVEQRKKVRAAAMERKKDRATLLRSADAHRKIIMGGLVIAAGADDWDPAAIVGALLAVAEQVNGQAERMAKLRERGLAHLEAREAARQGAKQ